MPQPKRQAGGQKPAKNAYRQQYGVIVICRDEAHQRKVYDRLKARGHTLKVVTT